MRDLNPVVSKDVNGMPVHRDPNVGSIAAFVSEGQSWYSGFDLGWRRRTHGGWIDVSYTLSKAEDLGPTRSRAASTCRPTPTTFSPRRGVPTPTSGTASSSPAPATCVGGLWMSGQCSSPPASRST